MTDAGVCDCDPSARIFEEDEETGDTWVSCANCGQGWWIRNPDREG